MGSGGHDVVVGFSKDQLKVLVSDLKTPTLYVGEGSQCIGDLILTTSNSDYIGVWPIDTITKRIEAAKTKLKRMVDAGKIPLKNKRSKPQVFIVRYWD